MTMMMLMRGRERGVVDPIDLTTMPRLARDPFLTPDSPSPFNP